MIKKLFKLTALAFSAFLCNVNKASAQVDPHFSQYYIYPQWLNPALTGVMDGDYRVAAIYRSQWANIDNGFKTIGLAAELVTNKDINVGVGMFSQQAGSAGFRYFNPTASICYTGVKFGQNATQHVTFGLQLGMMDKRFDPTKFKTGDMWNGTSVGPTPSQDVINNPTQTNFDIGAGVLYFDATPNKKVNAFLGLAFNHLTEPKDKFLASSSGDVTKMPMRRTLHGGVKINVNENLSITPNGLMMDQGTAHERMLGAYAQLKSGQGFDMLFGLNYRFNDAFVPFAGFYYKDFVLGLSYDVTTSDLSRIAGATSGFEISVSYTGRKRRKLDDQPFICPRL